MAKAINHLAGKKLIAEYRRRYGDTSLVSFSCGKDSIGAALAIRDDLDLVPVYYTIVPGLEFVEDSLDYYERKLFKRHILRMPHPSLYRFLNDYMFQPISNANIIAAADLPSLEFSDIVKMAIAQEKISHPVLTATGLRAADNALRNMSIRRHGPIRPNTQSWLPIWDWNKARLVAEITKANISLPIDYLLFGRSWEGLTIEYLEPLRKYCPRDYAKVVEWFPLIEVEFFRYGIIEKNADCAQKT